ncbi:hypothetical protein H6F61_06595 [Cyanobacteria bacterium FACHB-472]|nr:hypothetical protein [Cyanobacteria bacterium FACHB-472]
MGIKSRILNILSCPVAKQTIGVNLSPCEWSHAATQTKARVARDYENFMQLACVAAVETAQATLT